MFEKGKSECYWFDPANGNILTTRGSDYNISLTKLNHHWKDVKQYKCVMTDIDFL